MEACGDTMIEVFAWKAEETIEVLHSDLRIRRPRSCNDSLPRYATTLP